MPNTRDTSHSMKAGCWWMLHSSVNIEHHWGNPSAGWYKIQDYYFFLFVSPLRPQESNWKHGPQQSYQASWFKTFFLHEKCFNSNHFSNANIYCIKNWSINQNFMIVPQNCHGCSYNILIQVHWDSLSNHSTVAKVKYSFSSIANTSKRRVQVSKIQCFPLKNCTSQFSIHCSEKWSSCSFSPWRMVLEHIDSSRRPY